MCTASLVPPPFSKKKQHLKWVLLLFSINCEETESIQFVSYPKSQLKTTGAGILTQAGWISTIHIFVNIYFLFKFDIHREKYINCKILA